MSNLMKGRTPSEAIDRGAGRRVIASNNLFKRMLEPTGREAGAQATAGKEAPKQTIRASPAEPSAQDAKANVAKVGGKLNVMKKLIAALESLPQ